MASQALWDALKEGNEARAVMYVDEGSVDPNSLDNEGVPVLCYAAGRNYVELLRSLIKRGAKLDARTKDDQGPLFMACMSGAADAVRELVKNGVSPSSKFMGEEQVPAIVAAASRGHLQVIHELLKGGAWIDETDSQGHTALHTSCFCGGEQCAVFLVERGANVHLRSRRGALALAWAAHKGHLKTAKALIEKGADCNGEKSEGPNADIPSDIPLIPLHAAAKAGRVEVLKFLMDCGADIEKKNAAGETALHCAAVSDQSACALELLKRGAQYGAVDSKCRTVIEKASDAGSVATMELLVKWEQYNGEPPAEEKTVEEPAKWQPDLSKIDPLYYKLASWMGESQALVNAASRDEYSVCRSLLEQGADPNCAMKFSPLAAAAKEGHVRIVKMLLMSGADPAKESQKKLPIAHAEEAGRTEVVEILKNPVLCGGCGKNIPPNEVKRCGKCKIVKYCSPECQKTSWTRFHRRQCTIWAERKEQLTNRK